MTIEQYKNMTPRIDPSATVFDSAALAGDITVGKFSSIWFNASLRGDMAPITIGDRTNIQDNAVVHTNIGMPTHIGSNVTVGHSAIIHACTVEDDALIGMGSILLDGCVVEQGALVAAGTVVPPGKRVPARTLVLGNPMRIIRELTDEELAANRLNAQHYIDLMNDYK